MILGTRGAVGWALVLSFAALAPARAAEIAAPPDGYLVVPFENGTPIKTLDWMTSALATTVAEKLEVHPLLRPAYGTSILEGLPMKFDAAKVAARASDVGARWVIAGSYARPNWRAEVKLRLYQVVSDGKEAQLKLVGETEQVGERSVLFETLDQALLELLAKGGIQTDPAIATAIKRRPTKDLYALTLYGRALNFFYGYDGPIDLPSAQKILGRVVVIDPKFAEAHRVLGLVALERGEGVRASGQYAYALDLRPTYFSAMVGLARLYRAENRRPQALELGQKALELRPYDAEMRFLVGQLEWEAGDLEKALADLLLVIAAQPHHLGARRTLALVYATRGNVDELAVELGKVAELAPDDLEVRLDLGAAYMRLGRNAEALAVYEEVLKRQPKNGSALKFSGDLYRRMGDPERAIAAYEKLRHVVPDDPRPYFLLGAAYAEAGNDTKAEQVLQDAQEFRRHLGEAYTDLGAIAYRRGDLSKATWYLSRAVERSPMRPKAHFNYALVLNAGKQRERALSELKLASQLDPEDAECHYLAGVINLRLGRLDDAKVEFQEALKRKPTHPDAKFNLALLEDLQKRYGSERAGQGAQ